MKIICSTSGNAYVNQGISTALGLDTITWNARAKTLLDMCHEQRPDLVFLYGQDIRQQAMEVATAEYNTKFAVIPSYLKPAINTVQFRKPDSIIDLKKFRNQFLILSESDGTLESMQTTVDFIRSIRSEKLSFIVVGNVAVDVPEYIGIPNYNMLVKYIYGADAVYTNNQYLKPTLMHNLVPTFYDTTHPAVIKDFLSSPKKLKQFAKDFKNRYVTDTYQDRVAEILKANNITI